MKKEDKFENVIFAFIFMLILIAGCICIAFKNSHYGYLLEVKDYFNFAGSYGGAILSAVMSLMVLYVTVIQNREIHKENMKQVKISNINEEIKDYKELYEIVNNAEKELNNMLSIYTGRVWEYNEIYKFRQYKLTFEKCISQLESNPLLNNIYLDSSETRKIIKSIDKEINNKLVVEDTKKIIRLVNKLNTYITELKPKIINKINILIKTKYCEMGNKSINNKGQVDYHGTN